MSSIKEHVARHRRSLRAVTLLGVLVLCVAAAMLLVEYKSVDARRGADILAEIRTKALRTYLPAEKSENYYLITADGRPTGWKLVYAQPDENGGFSGGCVMMQNDPDGSVEISVSRWTLDATADNGQYMSQIFVKDALPQETYTTQITLGEQNVKLAQNFGGISMRSVSKRPANYIPEDLMQIAMFSVAGRKTSACFKTVYDAIASENSAVPFVTLMCRYDGQSDGLLRLKVRSNLEDSATEDSTFFFDKAGKNVKVLSPGGTVETLTDREKLQRAFPNSMNVIKTLIK